MSKRFGMAIMAGIMCMQMGGTVLANDILTINTGSNEVMQEMRRVKGDFISETGNVCTINNGQRGYELQVGSVHEGTIFYLPQNIIIFDVDNKAFLTPEAIKEGMNVSIVYPKDTPMALSLPGQCSGAQLVIIHSNKENAEIEYFNEELVNEENTLALNIDDQTVIMNNRGERRIFSAEDIKNKNAMVVYSVTTRSIPAQTTPSFVFIMEDSIEDSVEVSENQVIVKRDGTYKNIREVAEEKGFKVIWDNTNKMVTLIKENEEYRFTVEATKYFFNDEERELLNPVKLDSGSVVIDDITIIK